MRFVGTVTRINNLKGSGCNGIFLRAKPNQTRDNPGLALVLHLAQGTRLTCRTAPIFFSKPRTPLEDAFVYKCERRLAVNLAAAHASVSTSADKTKKHRVMAHILSPSFSNGGGIERCEQGLRTR